MSENTPAEAHNEGRTQPPVAVVIDISRSREHPDRVELQAEVSAVFATLNTLVPAVQEVEATIGDEFQGVYADIPSALRATLLALLLMPEGVECRFGLGDLCLCLVHDQPPKNSSCSWLHVAHDLVSTDKIRVHH